MNEKKMLCSFFLLLLFCGFSQFIDIRGYERNLNSHNYPLAHQTTEYEFIWEELADAPGDLKGDDIFLWGSSFGPYHNYSEIVSKIHDLNESFPQYVDLGIIGQTYFAKDIWYVKLTDEIIKTEDKTEILFVGQHHAREQITVENLLFSIDKIIEQVSLGNETMISLLEEKEIYIIPSLNIDGASILHKIPWHRKTLTPHDENYDGHDDTIIDGELEIEAEDVNGDGYIAIYEVINTNIIFGYEGYDIENATIAGIDSPGGVDPNRNYDYDYSNPYESSNITGSQTFAGEEAFSENCTRALRDFIQQHYFKGSIGLHSGTEAVYLPRVSVDTAKGDNEEDRKAEYNRLKSVSSTLADITGFREESRTPGGKYDAWMYYTQEQVEVSICLETYTDDQAMQGVGANLAMNYRERIGVWDYFNPPANQIISNSENIFNGLFYIMNLDYQSSNETIPSYPVILFAFNSLVGIFAIGIIITSKLKFKKLN